MEDLHQKVNFGSPIFVHNFFDLQTFFFDHKTVFIRFLAEIRLRNATKITSKCKFSTHFVQIPYHLHPARQGAHPAFSNSLQMSQRSRLCRQNYSSWPFLSHCTPASVGSLSYASFDCFGVAGRVGPFNEGGPPSSFTW